MTKIKLFFTLLILITGLTGCFSNTSKQKPSSVILTDKKEVVEKKDNQDESQVLIEQKESENIVNVNRGVQEEQVVCEKDKNLTSDEYINDEMLKKIFEADDYIVRSQNLSNFICPKIIQCATDKYEELTSKNRYNIVHGCLYDNNERVFRYNLLAYAETGVFFDDRFRKIGYEEYPGRGLGEGINEWFRFEEDNKLYIFLHGSDGCGGCIFSGPYLEIDLISDEIKTKEEWLPSLVSGVDSVVLSPDKKVAIISSYESDLDFNIKNEELLLYDFRTFESKSVFEFSADKTIISFGHGFNPVYDAVEWLDDYTIQVQLYEKDEGGADNLDNVGATEKSGNPIIIKIKR